ncbi:MAG: hypothetical protein AB1938_17120 [Myxococcota bacterium]
MTAVGGGDLSAFIRAQEARLEITGLKFKPMALTLEPKEVKAIDQVRAELKRGSEDDGGSVEGSLEALALSLGAPARSRRRV